MQYSRSYRSTDHIEIGSQKSYGCLGFFGDILMTIVTSGLWLIWIFVREMRRR